MMISIFIVTLVMFPYYTPAIFPFTTSLITFLSFTSTPHTSPAYSSSSPKTSYFFTHILSPLSPLPQSYNYTFLIPLLIQKVIFIFAVLMHAFTLQNLSNLYSRCIGCQILNRSQIIIFLMSMIIFMIIKDFVLIVCISVNGFIKGGILFYQLVES